MNRKLWRCDTDFGENVQNTLESCLNKKIKLGELIGSGTYGQVYLAKYNNIKCAIKIVTPMQNQTHEELIEDMEHEVEYNVYMASRNIGPKIYSAFYVMNRRRIECFIIMEAFEGSVGKMYDKLSLDNITLINAKMRQLLHKQVFDYNMYCTDLKPDNCVARIKNGTYIVRLIDFGRNFCNINKLNPIYENAEKFYLIMLVQLMLLSYHNIRKHHKDAAYTLSPFLEDPIFKKSYKNGYINGDFKNYLLKIYNYNMNETIVHSHYAKWYLEKIIKNNANVNTKNLVDGTIHLINKIVTHSSGHAKVPELKHNISPSISSIIFTPRTKGNMRKLSPKVGRSRNARITKKASNCNLNKQSCIDSDTCKWIVGTGCRKK